MVLDTKTKVVLTVIEGYGKGKIFEFKEQDNFLTGRDSGGSNAHFRLSPMDDYASRNHFLIEINHPDCYLRDAGSLNGTFIIRDAEKAVFFIEGREKKKDYFVETTRLLKERFQCETVRKIEEIIKLQNNDIIKAGNTLLQATVVKNAIEIPGAEVKDPADEQEVFTCLNCGKNIDIDIQKKDAKETACQDFFCKECRDKKTKTKKTSPKEVIACMNCGKNLNSVADTDGRAEELKEAALYCCKSCVNSQQDDMSVSQIGEYHILREIGSGGFGIVYLAWHDKTNRVVALKITREKIKEDERLLKRFKKEIAIMQQLNHPNLVKLYDNGVTEDESYYFVSEYLSEGSLTDVFRKSYKGRMPYRDACKIMVQSLDGLSYFHTQMGYVHRDLKPENIFLKKDKAGEFIAKVGDYSLARSYILHGETITRQGEWAGSILYCPPEQIHDFKNVKPPTDIYSMGITLYLLITGEFPYDFPPSRKKLIDMVNKGKKPRQPISIILGDDLPVPVERKTSDIPAGLARAINRAIIKKEPDKRFASADELKEAIKEYAV